LRSAKLETLIEIKHALSKVVAVTVMIYSHPDYFFVFGASLNGLGSWKAQTAVAAKKALERRYGSLDISFDPVVTYAILDML
jgi:hypothetical protein